MLQIPILVLFTIFYVSSPGWPPLMGLGTQDPVANVPSIPPVKGKWVQMPPASADVVPSLRDLWWRGPEGTHELLWGCAGWP